MESTTKKNLGISLLVVAFAFIAAVQSAPNNVTTPGPTPAPVASAVNATKVPTIIKVNATVSSTNKTINSSDEDCEAEPEAEPTANGKTDAKTGSRQGKELIPDHKDTYNTTANASAGVAGSAKLQGNATSTTAAPTPSKSTTFSPSSLWANVILTTLLLSFTYSSL